MDFFEGMSISDIVKEKYGQVAGSAFSAMVFNDLNDYNNVKYFWHNIQESDLDQNKKDEIYILCNELINEEVRSKKQIIIEKINNILNYNNSRKLQTIYRRK